MKISKKIGIDVIMSVLFVNIGRYSRKKKCFKVPKDMINNLHDFILDVHRKIYSKGKKTYIEELEMTGALLFVMGRGRLNDLRGRVPF